MKTPAKTTNTQAPPPASLTSMITTTKTTIIKINDKMTEP